MVVIVCGDRHWKNFGRIYGVMSKLPKERTIIITGGQAGADVEAHAAALTLNYETVVCEAAWNTYSKKAGPVRNELMLHTLLAYNKAYELDTGVIAFHNNIKESRGTKHMLAIAEKEGIRTRLYGTD